MDEIARARRLTWVTLIFGLAITWFLIGVGILAGVAEGRLLWWRLVPALIATVCFTWLSRRIIDAILDRRYPTKRMVWAAVLALIAAGLGGADPFGFGFVPMCWLYLATLGVSRRTAVLQSLGVFVATVGLGMLGVATGASVMAIDVSPAELLVYYVLLNGLWCVILPPSGRMWVWIWTLAVQAHEGREAHTRLALAEERLRFARDLHDLVGHQLSAIAVKTELAVRLSDGDPAAAKAEMAEINTLTRKALRELREAVRGYRELDLAAELDSVKSVLEAAGVRCEVHLPYRDLPAGVAPVFAYAVREAITNVLKHSTATFCDITIRFTEEEAELRVRNDGVARRHTDDLGSGLTGMGERVSAVGGKLAAHPTGDGEFLLTAVVSLPLRG
ncbi:sensor histidine kinase [Nonomuraea turkmeniaca]|uniref:Sensor histidine kinase n=1 Tax=Nonomuraea turkmeniaca TaxID=103838 RepID=A0A5S4G760_9ACTN|nr:histidine kinase [Nonomuraea turkmeniaca]TMR21770.1 sensor histidine kinase [Nonomuraea turkmeniaca]